MSLAIVTAVALASLVAALGATYAVAKDLEGVRFAEGCEQGRPRLRLNDVGLMRYRCAIKA